MKTLFLYILALYATLTPKHYAAVYFNDHLIGKTEYK